MQTKRCLESRWNRPRQFDKSRVEIFNDLNDIRKESAIFWKRIWMTNEIAKINNDLTTEDVMIHIARTKKPKEGQSFYQPM